MLSQNDIVFGAFGVSCWLALAGAAVAFLSGAL